MKSEETVPSNHPDGEGEPPVCAICGMQLSAADVSCPVCMLRGALGESPEIAGSASERTSDGATAESKVHRFEHYELVKGQDGKPLLLCDGGRCETAQSAGR
jgi:hypothetical protein